MVPGVPSGSAETDCKRIAQPVDPCFLCVIRASSVIALAHTKGCNSIPTILCVFKSKISNWFML